MKRIVFGFILAAAFWLIMFSPWTAGKINFWATMVGATGVLAGLGLYANRRIRKELFGFKWTWIPIGLASAAVLYLVFLLGDVVSTAMFGFAKGQVDRIYTFKSGTSPVVIGLLLLLWIGPAEEIF